MHQKHSSLQRTLDIAGLSPPTRGSLGARHVRRPCIREGSIPAHAGEPSLAETVPPRAARGVYPRPRGGALGPQDSQRNRRGTRSIPAHAGEPLATGMPT